MIYRILILSLFLSTSCINVFGQSGQQKVLIEVFTGTWVGYAPDGFVVLEDALAQDTNIHAVNIHIGDLMECSNSSDIENFYSPAYPQALINREGSPISRNTWASSSVVKLSDTPLLDVLFDSVFFNSSTRQLDVYLRAHFVSSATGDLRFNCIVVEDSVIGMGSGYDQANYYNTTVSHYYYGAGDPIVGVPHRYVAREFLGSAWGVSGIIPSSVSAGSDYTHHFTYTIPAGYDYEQISLIGFVSKYAASGITEREILNLENYLELTPMSTNSIDDQKALPFYQIYPNPSVGNIVIDCKKNVEIKIVNMLSEELYSSRLTAGRTELKLDLNVGIYIIRFNDGENSWSQKIVIE